MSFNTEEGLEVAKFMGICNTITKIILSIAIMYSYFFMPNIFEEIIVISLLITLWFLSDGISALHRQEINKHFTRIDKILE